MVSTIITWFSFGVSKSTVKMSAFRSLGVASLLASVVHAAVSSTGFTVSLADVDYFLPPKAVSSITGCDEIKSLFENGMFVPITVTSEGASDLSSYAHQDDVWQEGFLEGIRR